MKYIIEAQALIKIEVEANSEYEAERKAEKELEDIEGIDWMFSTHLPECCENCKYGIDYGESVDYIRCEKVKRSKDVKKKDRCTLYEERKVKK